MSDVRLIETFTALGFEPADAQSRAALTSDVTGAFRARVGADPRWRWFVPGRIEIFGKHTDYAGGRSLLCAVPRGFAVAASPRSDDVVRVIDVRRRETASVVTSDEHTQMHGWSRYAAVVVRRLARNFPGASLGADIALASDLPPAAGLSSSSALVVALATALVRRAGLDDRPEWRAAIHTPLDLAGYLGATENGLTFGSLAGVSGIGTHGGSEDHTAILTSLAGRVRAYAFVPVRPMGEAAMPADWRFVVASSGVVADKGGSVLDRYNRASLATRALVDVWNQAFGDECPTLAAALARAPDAADRLQGALTSIRVPAFSADELSKRLRHFLGEDSRIMLARQAFHDADASRLGELARASQHDADALLGNQIDETRLLTQLAIPHGAWAATSFGAGFGGSVWAMAPASDAREIGQRWTDAYRAHVPPTREVEWFVANPSPGLVETTSGVVI